MEDHIAALNASIPAIIESVVVNSREKDYYNEFGAEKSEKIRTMVTELLNGMMGYLKTANLDHARTEMKIFQDNTPSQDSGLELKALWADIIAAATVEKPASGILLRQVWGVFDRLINESNQKISKN